MSGPREPLLFVDDMVGAVEFVMRACDGRSDDELRCDTVLTSALLWQLTIVGEAAKSVPPEVRERHGEVDWVDAARTRDKVVHHYWGVDTEELIAMVRHDLPGMLPSLRRVRDELLAEWQAAHDAEAQPPDW